MNKHDFTNTETWIVWLWSSDDLLQLRENTGSMTPQNAEAFVELGLEMACDNGLEGDMLRAAMSKVNWHEISYYVNN